MLARLKFNHKPEKAAKQVYATILEHIRNPAFYSAYGVKDAFEPRFDLLCLHTALVILHMKDNPEFNQALFDMMFVDMDQTLREMGIGDMGIPKHMRRMMKAFNGRLHAYEQGLQTETLAEALEKNLYNGAASQASLAKMLNYIKDQEKFIAAQDKNDIAAGTIRLAQPTEK